FPALPLWGSVSYQRPMPSTGDRLRSEREHRKLTLSEAAEATKIKGDHLRAIEAGDWAVFTAPVYVRGFVKTYARYLRVDEHEIVTQLDEELAGRGSFAEGGGSQGLRRGPLDAVMLKLALVRWQILFPALLGLTLIVVAVWAWKAWKQQPPATMNMPPARLYQPRTSALSATLPLPPTTNDAAGRTSR
ncbi:MAG TPA: helix-turn-helix domain-containing protein, partial [Verrucomicrobiota bacterium]|nr:helix-turn-helix domain-containing protein [Verrucomicrobiota bacterium]